MLSTSEWCIDVWLWWEQLYTVIPRHATTDNMHPKITPKSRKWSYGKTCDEGTPVGMSKLHFLWTKMYFNIKNVPVVNVRTLIEVSPHHMCSCTTPVLSSSKVLYSPKCKSGMRRRSQKILLTKWRSWTNAVYTPIYSINMGVCLAIQLLFRQLWDKMTGLLMKQAKICVWLLADIGRKWGSPAPLHLGSIL